MSNNIKSCKKRWRLKPLATFTESCNHLDLSSQACTVYGHPGVVMVIPSYSKSREPILPKSRLWQQGQMFVGREKKNTSLFSMPFSGVPSAVTPSLNIVWHSSGINLYYMYSFKESEKLFCSYLILLLIKHFITLYIKYFLLYKSLQELYQRAAYMCCK